MTRNDVPRSPSPCGNKSAGCNAGHLFIVSAPSGAGKTTVCKAVRRYFNDLSYSVSYTTRFMRNGERHGQDYFFITREEFERGIRRNRWAEWANVHGNYYGTSARWIARNLDQGKNILLDIDVQGMQQLVRQFPDAVTIFLAPPSMDELRRRLTHRGSDDDETIELRMTNARAEMEQRNRYRHVVINDDLAQARQQLISIIASYLRD